jgi:hypothetical protein
VTAGAPPGAAACTVSMCPPESGSSGAYPASARAESYPWPRVRSRTRVTRRPASAAGYVAPPCAAPAPPGKARRRAKIVEIVDGSRHMKYELRVWKKPYLRVP